MTNKYPLPVVMLFLTLTCWSSMLNRFNYNMRVLLKVLT